MSVFVPAFYSPGAIEILVIMVVVLIVFGPGKLPEVFKALGSGMRQFKEAANPEQFAAKTETKTIEAEKKQPENVANANPS